MTVGATWDVELASAWGKAMGEEFYFKGSNVQLGPGLCVARVPRNGRNFEYLSGEDPFLGEIMAKPLIESIQSNGVIANAKHWVNNNQETNRRGDTAAVDERTRFEMYYPPFAGAIAGNVGSFMCSYNLIQAEGLNEKGDWSCENNATLRTDLKARFAGATEVPADYTAWVMSDWGATHSTSIMRGLDQEMPGGGKMGSPLIAAVESGQIPLSFVDDSVLRILTPMYVKQTIVTRLLVHGARELPRSLAPSLPRSLVHFRLTFVQLSILPTHSLIKGTSSVSSRTTRTG